MLYFAYQEPPSHEDLFWVPIQYLVLPVSMRHSVGSIYVITYEHLPSSLPLYFLAETLVRRGGTSIIASADQNV